MENFIEQAETISFGAINVVRWTQWQLCKREREMELVGGVNGWACSLSVFEVFNIEAANPEPKMIEARVRSPSLPLSLSLCLAI